MAQWDSELSLSAEQAVALAASVRPEPAERRALGPRASRIDDALLRRMVDFTLELARDAERGE